MARIPTMLLLLLFLGYFIFGFLKSVFLDIRNKNIKKGLVKLGTVFIVIIGLNWIINYNVANSLGFVDKNVKSYVMNIDEVKTDNEGTKIKLNKVFMDLNTINFSVGVKGKNKLVAIEVKKNPKDKEVLAQMQGMWLGHRLSYEYNGIGTGFKSEEYINSLYIVCYMSNGEDVAFKVEDKNNIKEKTEIIQINKDFDYNGNKIRLKTLTRGINYTNLEVASDIGFFDHKFYIIQEGKEFENGPSGGSGGKYSFSFGAIKKEDITIRLVIKGSNQEYTIKVR